MELFSRKLIMGFHNTYCNIDYAPVNMINADVLTTNDHTIDNLLPSTKYSFMTATPITLNEVTIST
uniref:Uncharacterized protein n=1 Tax=Daucus carota subsp. sativus TaxID=79200 RepID=A0A165A5H3_DAUCS